MTGPVEEELFAAHERALERALEILEAEADDLPPTIALEDV